MTDAPRRVEARNPLTGRVDYVFEAPAPADLHRRCAALRAAQPRWRALGPDRRAAALRDWRARVTARRGELFAALSADVGRRALAAQEIDAALAMIDRWAGDAPALLAEAPPGPSRVFPHIAIAARAEPYRLVGAISPWNYPLLLALIDAVPALLAGAAVFIKPSEVTPRFIEPLRATIAETGELAGALDIAAGDGATGAALIPLVDAVAFTGSVATGRKVADAAARAFIPAFLELGGKDPAIVLHGADLDRAATAILRASVVGTGQACQSIERIYVDAREADAFLERLIAKARATRLACEPGGIIGPLIFARQAEIIADQLADATAKGAIVHCGGRIESHGGGRWIAPTVVTGVNHGMKLMTEETFGPIMPVMTFETVDEAVRLANDSIYGLSAAVFGPNEEEAGAVAARLDAGGVSINDAGLTTMVFEAEKNGFKLSGLGPSRMGPMGLLRFLRRKALYFNRGAVAPIEAFAETD
jgi:acyl-CoA reductase-like NAD-dependent aldehyde dehydrogenase